MKILVVDDEELIRDVIKEYLEANNYIVDEASNGIEALEKLENNKYDLLILDIMMKELDGFSMLDRLDKSKMIPTNFSAHTVKIDNKLINLTPKEFEILSYLIKNKNTAISREQLLSKLWGYDFFGDYRIIDTHIKLLRNNLEEYRNLIETVRGIGYKFNDEK